MYEIGHRWAADGLNVAEEHYATAVTQQLLDELSARIRMPPCDGRLAVVTGTPGERHGLGARMVADFLEADGWEVLQLGPDTPATTSRRWWTASAGRGRPLHLHRGLAAGDRRRAGRLGRLQPRPCLVVGGQFWTAETSRAAQELGADVVVRDLRDLTALLRERIPPREP